MSAHTLHNSATNLEEFGMRLSAFLDVQVYKAGWGARELFDAVTAVSEGVYDQWTGMSVLREYGRDGKAVVAYVPDPTTSVEDEPNHGGHTCVWLSALAYSQNLQSELLALSDRTREGGSEHVVEGDGWCFYDDRLFFDPANRNVRRVINRMELPAYYGDVVEDRLCSLEDEYVRSVSWPSWWDLFKMEFDDTIDKGRVEQSYLEYESSACGQCFTTTRPEHVLDGIAVKCVECGDTWTDKGRNKCEYC